MNTRMFFSLFSKDGSIRLLVGGQEGYYNETEYNQIREPYRLLSDRQHYQTINFKLEKVII